MCRALYITLVSSILFVHISCVPSMVLCPKWEVVTTTGDSISAGAVNCCMTLKSTFCYNSRLYVLCDSMYDIFDSFFICSRLVPASCINTKFCTWGGCFLMQEYREVVLIKVKTGKSSTIRSLSPYLYGFHLFNHGNDFLYLDQKICYSSKLTHIGIGNARFSTWP